MARPSFLCLLIAVLLMGCWDDHHRVAAVTSSEDDTLHAWVEHRFQQRDSFGSGFIGSAKRRNQQVRVGVQRADGGGRRLLTDWVDGVPEADGLYLQRAAGYVLHHVEVGDTRAVEVIGLDGERWSPRRADTRNACAALRGLPDPSGALIAVLERPGQGDGPDCFGPDARITFFDVGTRRTLDDVSVAIDAGVDFAWDDGALYLWNFRGVTWRLVPGEPPVLADRPACTSPRTDSSPTQDDGVRLEPGTPEAPISLGFAGAPPCR